MRSMRSMRRSKLIKETVYLKEIDLSSIPEDVLRQCIQYVCGDPDMTIEQMDLPWNAYCRDPDTGWGRMILAGWRSFMECLCRRGIEEACREKRRIDEEWMEYMGWVKSAVYKKMRVIRKELRRIR